jgi:hypothetical protein
MGLEPAKLMERYEGSPGNPPRPSRDGHRDDPYEVVYEEDRVKLKHYKPEEVLYNFPLFVCYPR